MGLDQNLKRGCLERFFKTVRGSLFYSLSALLHQFQEIPLRCLEPMGGFPLHRAAAQGQGF